MLVRDYMIPYPQKLHVNDSLKDAARLFLKYKIDGAPIVGDDDRICGIIISSDFAKAIINDISFQQPVSTVMTSNVISIKPDASIEEAYQIPVRRLPVISPDNKVVGMLTKSDFLNAYRSEAIRSINIVEALISSTHNGIIIINAFGIITTFNETAANIIGIPVTKASGKPIEDVIPDSGLRKVLSTGVSERGCHLAINGQIVFSNRSPIFEGARIVGALAILQDTSELSEVSKLLSTTKQAFETLENIFESTREGIIVVDETGVVTRVNKSLEDLFHIERQELIGRSAEEMIENTRVHIVAQTGIPELGIIQSYKGKEFLVNLVPIFKNGNKVGAVGEISSKNPRGSKQLLEYPAAPEKARPCSLPPIKDASPGSEFTIDNIIGSSHEIVHAKNLAMKAARNENNVLILGESGTGKELFAHAIHNASPRSKMPFIAVNCAAIPSELMESELFGYEEGSFTGAKKGGKKGKFELAEKGTLFLDEIGDMPLSMQAKILRVLQDKVLDHIGGSKSLHCDVRIMAATNKNLTHMVQEQTFREDLYYRLNVLCIKIPPLRDRKEDIGELISHLVPTICQRQGIPPKQFTPEALEILRHHLWSGNIRELINLLEQIAALVDNQLITPQHLMRANFLMKFETNGHVGDGFEHSVSVNERDKIVEVLKYAGNNKVIAAKLLGFHRATLYRKIKEYGL